MKQRNKVLSALLAAVMLTALLSLCAFAAEVEVNKKSCVMDHANVLDWETEAYITQVTTALDEACGGQIGVYTVDYIGNTTMEDYCYQVFNAWGVGDKEKNNGVVLLMAIGEDDYYVSRGDGIEKQLSAATLKRILNDHLEPNWVEGNFDQGAKDTVLALAREVAGIYGVSLTIGGESYAAPEKTPWTWESTLGVFVFLILMLPIILAVFSFFGPVFNVVFMPFALLFELMESLFGWSRPRTGGYSSRSHYGSGSSYRPSGSSYRSSGSSYRSSGSSYRSSGSSYRSSGSFRGMGGGHSRGGGAGRH